MSGNGYIIEALTISGDIIYNLYNKQLRQLLIPPHNVYKWVNHDYVNLRKRNNSYMLFNHKIILEDLIPNNSIFINRNVGEITKRVRRDFVDCAMLNVPREVVYWQDNHINALNRYHDALANNNKHIKVIEQQVNNSKLLVHKYSDAYKFAKRLYVYYQHCDKMD